MLLKLLSVSSVKPLKLPDFFLDMNTMGLTVFQEFQAQHLSQPIQSPQHFEAIVTAFKAMLPEKRTVSMDTLVGFYRIYSAISYQAGMAVLDGKLAMADTFSFSKDQQKSAYYLLSGLASRSVPTLQNGPDDPVQVDHILQKQQVLTLDGTRHTIVAQTKSELGRGSFGKVVSCSTSSAESPSFVQKKAIIDYDHTDHDTRRAVHDMMLEALASSKDGLPAFVGIHPHSHSLADKHYIYLSPKGNFIFNTNGYVVTVQKTDSISVTVQHVSNEDTVVHASSKPGLNGVGTIEAPVVKLTPSTDERGLRTYTLDINGICHTFSFPKKQVGLMVVQVKYTDITRPVMFLPLGTDVPLPKNPLSARSFVNAAFSNLLSMIENNVISRDIKGGNMIVFNRDFLHTTDYGMIAQMDLLKFFDKICKEPQYAFGTYPPPEFVAAQMVENPKSALRCFFPGDLVKSLSGAAVYQTGLAMIDYIFHDGKGDDPLAVSRWGFCERPEYKAFREAVDGLLHKHARDVVGMQTHIDTIIAFITQHGQTVFGPETDRYVSFLSSCLSTDPTLRPSMKSIQSLILSESHSKQDAALYGSTAGASKSYYVEATSVSGHEISVTPSQESVSLDSEDRDQLKQALGHGILRRNPVVHQVSSINIPNDVFQGYFEGTKIQDVALFFKTFEPKTDVACDAFYACITMVCQHNSFKALSAEEQFYSLIRVIQLYKQGHPLKESNSYVSALEQVFAGKAGYTPDVRTIFIFRDPVGFKTKMKYIRTIMDNGQANLLHKLTDLLLLPGVASRAVVVRNAGWFWDSCRALSKQLEPPTGLMSCFGFGPRPFDQAVSGQWDRFCNKISSLPSKMLAAWTVKNGDKPRYPASVKDIRCSDPIFGPSVRRQEALIEDFAKGLAFVTEGNVDHYLR